MTRPARIALSVWLGLAAGLVTGCAPAPLASEHCHLIGGTWWEQRDCQHAAWLHRMQRDW